MITLALVFAIVILGPLWLYATRPRPVIPQWDR